MYLVIDRGGSRVGIFVGRHRVGLPVLYDSKVEIDYLPMCPPTDEFLYRNHSKVRWN